MEINPYLKEQRVICDYILKSHSITAALEFENNIRKTFLEDGEDYNSLTICIEKYANKELRVKLVDILSGCKCCDRHQINRPNKFESWVDTKFNNTCDTDCECKCRHFSRFICRTCE